MADDNLATIANAIALDGYRAAIVQLAELLAVLPDWSPPAPVAAALQGEARAA
jgi:hypothetical protein